MLIAEVSKLSETWEQLNKQNQSKVFELAQYDVRLERMATEKAKANQKYFASEREKEALTNQSNVYQRLSNQQKGAINLLENEKHALLNKLTNAEKELQEHQTAQNLFDKKISELVKTAEEHKAKAVTSEKQLEEVRKRVHQHAVSSDSDAPAGQESAERAHHATPLRGGSAKKGRRAIKQAREGGREMERKGEPSYCCRQWSRSLCRN